MRPSDELREPEGPTPISEEDNRLEAARGHLQGHPFLSEGKGRFSIEVFELVPMEM